MRVEILRPADPDRIADVNTPEAAAEFTRQRNAGIFGPRNEAEYQESLRIAAELELDGDSDWDVFGPHDLG